MPCVESADRMYLKSWNFQRSVGSHNRNPNSRSRDEEERHADCAAGVRQEVDDRHS